MRRIPAAAAGCMEYEWRVGCLRYSAGAAAAGLNAFRRGAPLDFIFKYSIRLSTDRSTTADRSLAGLSL